MPVITTKRNYANSFMRHSERFQCCTGTRSVLPHRAGCSGGSLGGEHEPVICFNYSYLDPYCSC